MLAERHTIDDFLERLDALRVFPSAAVKVAEVARTRGSALDDMERAASLDAALSGRLLKLANSPFYGMSREVKTLRRAVQVLGFHATRDLAISSAMAAIGADAGPQGKKLWAQSVHVGIAASAVAALVHGVERHQAFVAGLLADLGQLLFLSVDRPGYGALLQTFGSKDAHRLVQAERMHYGFDHAYLGAACLRRWSLPEPICVAVQLHHAQEWSGDFRDRLVPTLRVADALATAFLAGTAPAAVAAAVRDDDAAEILGLDERRLVQIAERTAKDLKEMATLV